MIYCLNVYYYVDFIKVGVLYYNNIVMYLWYIILRDFGLFGYFFLYVCFY